jgi:hypothetical protein
MQNAEQEFTPEELVPLALIALEADDPIEQVVDLLGADVVLDAVGMRAVSAELRVGSSPSVPSRRTGWRSSPAVS